MIEFYKYQGAGNDFIMIDNLDNAFQDDKITLAQKYCNRHFGIGSDGLIFLEQSLITDFKMDFYNPDGSQSFCGNGSRCAVAFARFLNIFSEDQVKFEAIDGIHHAQLLNNSVKVSMQPVSEITMLDDDIFMNTGSPHYIKEVDDLKKSNLIEIGRDIRYAKEYQPGGTNVNLIQNLGIDKIAIRTYERGVENETYACGTGATAAALAYAIKNEIKTGKVDVSAIGGDLKVYFMSSNQGFDQIYLEGPANFVFKGLIDNA